MLDTCNYGTASRALEICRHQCSLSSLNRSWLRMCTVQGQHCCHASHAAADTQLAPSEDRDSPGTCSAVISASAGPRRPTRSGNSASISRKYRARTGRPTQQSQRLQTRSLSAALRYARMQAGNWRHRIWPGLSAYSAQHNVPGVLLMQSALASSPSAFLWHLSLVFTSVSVMPSSRNTSTAGMHSKLAQERT